MARMAFLVFAVTTPVLAQAPPQNPLLHEGSQLDLKGKGVEARQVFQKAIDTAGTPLDKANA